MTRVLLVRHALCDPVGHSLAGRAPGVLLNEEGLAQAERLAVRVSREPVEAVYSSPLERAWETAGAIARRASVAVQRSDGLVELDFGAWTGRRFADMEGDEWWQRYNAQRQLTAPPGGELPAAAQVRAVATLLGIAQRHPRGTVAAVSHADIIRSVLIYALGAPLEHLLRLEIAPASLSELELEPWGARVLSVNDRSHLPGA